jgi:hypothetical protein
MIRRHWVLAVAVGVGALVSSDLLLVARRRNLIAW